MAFWDRLSSRGRVEDRRALGPATVGGIGVGGIALVMLVSVLTGGDPTQLLLQLLSSIPSNTVTTDTSQFEGSDEYEVFASTVLGSNNTMWETKFSQLNQDYREPRLVLFREATESACGLSTSQVGPHYCPLDETIYLDETFFDELTRRFGARGGDVAEAYVIAHEVGHHAQKILGFLRTGESNEASIAVELQADCFAGLWANSIADRQVFEPGEIAEAMDMAAAVGDDRIQEAVTGRVNPESWTHGSSEQRIAAFERGYRSGALDQCQAF